MRLASLVAKMAGMVGARVLGAIVGFASQLVLARLLSIEDVGIVFLGTSAAAIIALVANGGYALLVTTELPKWLAHGRHSLVEAFNKVAVVDSLIAYVCLCAVGWILGTMLGFGPGQKMALVVGFITAPASMAMRYNASLAMVARMFRTSYVPDFLFRPALFLVVLLLAASAGWMHSAKAALIIFTATVFITTIGQQLALKGQGLSLRHLSWPRPAFARGVRAKAFALTLVSAMMYAFADIVILIGGFVLPEADVAILGVAMRLAAIAGFVLQAGQMLMVTDFTQALVRRDEGEVANLLTRVNLSTAAIALAGLAGVFVLGDFALGLFGDVYRQGKWLLVLLLVGQSLRALGGMNQQILSIHGYQMRTAGSCVLALVILVCLSVVLCRPFGFIGIGYAVVATELAWLVALASQAQRLCGRRGDFLWVLASR